MSETSNEASSPKYRKLLKNLLDIKRADQTIFSKVNGTDHFDVITKFGSNFAEKILLQNKFTLNLVERDLEQIRSELVEANSAEEIIAIYEHHNERLFQVDRKLLQNESQFATTRAKLQEKLDIKIQKTVTRWQSFRRKVIDTNMQGNIWPLYVATAFISIKTSRRECYGPLLLKKVNVQVDGSRIKITTIEENWELNEKLIFLLKEENLPFDDETSLKEKTTAEAINFIGDQFTYDLNPQDLLQPFKNLYKNDVQNRTVIFRPGVTLGLFSPAGGQLRKTMLQIIDDDAVDDIIEVDPDKSIYKNKINGFIANNSQELVYIQPHNYSQNKALASALIQDTVIWGPPGTGKSQVIANIIANVLYRDKSAVVMSQKKASLDVLKKRLGKLQYFALFILNSNKLGKSEFYRPLQEFIYLVENHDVEGTSGHQPLVSKDEKRALAIINAAKNNQTYDISLEFIEKYHDHLRSLNELFSLPTIWTYPNPDQETKLYLEDLATKNNISKHNFLGIKYYPKHFKKEVERIWYFTRKSGIDLNEVIKYTSKTNLATINALLEVPELLHRNRKFHCDEDYLVNVLSARVIEAINYWKTNKSPLFKDYKRFANAIRAGRRLSYKFINDHAEIIRILFPVIITNPETSFINWGKDAFDYAILDESSQIFPEIGLPILHLAKIKVLAGDPKQMQPSRWFGIRDDQEEEEDVVENAGSLLDYGLHKGVFQVMLDKNYRSSAAALMAYSAKTFYNSELQVIDDPRKKEDQPIEVINVAGQWEKNTNRVEAEKVIEIANENLGKYEKIIILTFNSPQQQLVEQLIMTSESDLLQAIEDEVIMLRNIENIQGDEADLVIATVAYDATTTIAGTYVARPGGKNALNVAISRARAKMIVIKSVTSSTIRSANSEDYQVFREWLAFLDKSELEQREFSAIEEDPDKEIGELPGDVESGFERDVINLIRRRIRTYQKYDIIKQYPVGSRRIDIAIVDDAGNYQLGIEVDGYRYHGGQGYDKYLQDFARQEFLEAKGYPIYRIREIDWRLVRNNLMEEMEAILNDRS